MLSRERWRRLLNKIKKHQIEEEIKYLESSVIIRGNLVYDVSGGGGLVDDKEVSAKLKRSLVELERVSGMAVGCLGNFNQTKMVTFSQLERRLQEVESIIQE